MTSPLSLAFGRDHLAIPGPSTIPSRVLRAMHRPAPNIYEGELVDVAESVYRDLAGIAGCSGHAVIYIGNGHAAWEASITNLFSRGDRLLGLVTGRFGAGWAGMAQDLGVEAELLDFGHDASADPERIEAALRADTAHRIRAVTTVQTDTSTSVSNDIGAVRAAMDAAGHPALLLVDCICSFGCEPFDMDALGVDVMVAACQKGLMTPPGLAFNFVGAKALEAHANAGLRTPYWNWSPRVNPSMFPERFCGTPPTHHLFGLREALDLLLEEGMANVHERHRAFARSVWAAIDAWGERGELACNVPVPAHRSLAVTAVRTADGDGPALRAWCEREAGVTVGVGLPMPPPGPPREGMFRIGHMGHLGPPMLLGTLATIDAGLKACGIAHGDGALEAASRTIARSVVAVDGS